MRLRKYDSDDCAVLAELFYNTVHNVNVIDYTKDQLHAWATGSINLSDWDISFLKRNTIIAEMEGKIVGFGDMDSNGYLDRLYVHHKYQRRGIATAIVEALEEQAMAKGIFFFTTDASTTANPFFEHHGYYPVRKNVVVRNGIELMNVTMEKRVSKLRG